MKLHREVADMDPEVLKQLEALGVGKDAIPQSAQDRVHDALCYFWRCDGECPPNVALCDYTGLGHTSVVTALAKLVRTKRAFRVRPGVYVPKVTE